MTDLRQKIEDQCLDCAETKKIVDNEFGNIYSFAAIFGSKMSTTAGYRQRGEPQTINKNVTVHFDVTASRHGYDVTEVPERLFSAENRHSEYYLISLYIRLLILG